MSTKHTKGPWETKPEECDKPYIRVRGSMPGGRYKVANVLTPTYPGVHDREAEETRANARLIAAAPELLEALQRIEKRIAYYASMAAGDAPNIEQWAYTDQSGDMAIVRAAIAKATGEHA